MPNEIIGSPNNTLEVSYKVGPKGVRKTGSLTYSVVGETTATSEDSIIATPGLPQMYSVVNGMYVIGITASQVSPTKHPTSDVETWLWHVAYEFDSEIDTDLSINPLLRPPVLSWGGTIETDRLVWDAVTGNLVATAAGEPLDLDRPLVLPTLNIQRYHSYPFDPDLIKNNCGGVNSAVYRGAPIGTALLLPATSRTVVIEQTKYESVNYQVKFKFDPDDLTRQDTWKITVPNRGTWWIDDFGNRIYGARGGVPFIVDLNADGTPNNTGTPVTLSFNRNFKTDFATNLGI